MPRANRRCPVCGRHFSNLRGHFATHRGDGKHKSEIIDKLIPPDTQGGSRHYPRTEPEIPEAPWQHWEKHVEPLKKEPEPQVSVKDLQILGGKDAVLE